ncbi:MAG TPA: HAD family hydrolase [Pirellulales bacterium]
MTGLVSRATATLCPTGSGAALHSRFERSHSRPTGTVASGGAASGGTSAIRGLVMEMANVLYDATLWRRELVRLLVRLHVPATYPAFFHRWEREYSIDVERGFRQYEEAFQAFLLSAGLSWGQIDEVEAVARCQRHAYEENVRPLPAVSAALSALTKRGLPLVALCDAAEPASVLERRIERLGLRGVFQHVLSSFDLGAAKPAPECYAAALAALELPAAEAAFIGCDRRSLDGAAAYGLRTIAFNCQEEVEADARLESFADIVELVEHWPSVGSVEASP